MIIETRGLRRTYLLGETEVHDGALEGCSAHVEHASAEGSRPVEQDRAEFGLGVR